MSEFWPLNTALPSLLRLVEQEAKEVYWLLHLLVLIEKEMLAMFDFTFYYK